jgi:hypothetical protein
VTPFADGVWLDTHPVSIVGMSMTSTMSVLDLGNGELLVCSPVALTPERRSAVDALGTVKHVYAPNLYHHSWASEWVQAFPEARLHGPRGLSKKRPDLKLDRAFGGVREPAFSDVVGEHFIEGFRLSESVLVHRPSGTLVVTDLVHNVGKPEGVWPRLYTRAMGFYDRVALSRMLRWLAFSDRALARKSIDALFDEKFDRLVVGHGAPLESGAKDVLRGALEWLR